MGPPLAVLRLASQGPPHLGRGSPHAFSPLPALVRLRGGRCSGRVAVARHGIQGEAPPPRGRIVCHVHVHVPCTVLPNPYPARQFHFVRCLCGFPKKKKKKKKK